MDLNKQIYSAGKALSLIDRAAFRVRREIYDILDRQVSLNSISSILDIGVTADQQCISSNVFENLYPYPDRITVLSDQDAKWMEETYPGLKFVFGDGRYLPFADNSFDLVYSSAVIEHVGSFENQVRMVAECVRVSKNYIFLTTPNKWHPLEFHTALPFVHWLPKSFHRRFLSLMGYDSLAFEQQLNLLSTKEIKKICVEIGLQSYKIISPRFLGFRSNLLMFADLSVQKSFKSKTQLVEVFKN